MNDRYDGYTGDQYELVGYDEFGQPVYRQVPPPQGQQPPQQPQQPQQPEYGGYGNQQPQQPQQGQQGYGYDPYGTGQQPVVPPSPYDGYGTYDPYGQGQGQGGQDGPGTGTMPAYDPYGQAAGTGQQPRVAEQTAYIPQQTAPHESGYQAGPGAGPGAGSAPGGGPEPDPDPSEPRDYRTEQFAFVEEPDGDSEDVIDWLQFTENRTERREEAKRRARSRIVALVVVLALIAAGGVGYLWYAGKLPGLSSDSKSGTPDATGPQNRDVIVVHLHNTKKKGTSTALLVDNTTTKQGSTVLLPNALAVTDDNGTATTLGKSVDDDGSTGTRESIDTLLGTAIEGTWRLDTPYLNNLVELVGNIDIDTDTDVPADKAKKGDAPLVKKGEQQTLSGPMAVAYATYRAPDESENAQLTRFGQVMQGVLRKLSSDATAATTTVQSLAQILDPSLKEKDLGAFLAKLADRAKGGDYKTALLPLQADGNLTEQATASVVKDVLGGTVKSPEKGAAVRVGIRNATGGKSATESARIILVNGGYTFVDAGTGTPAQTATRVTYGDTARKQDAVEVAKTLGLPTSAVKKGEPAANADVSVVLGQDFKPE
ncbi:LCP family protein [Streptomyces sp. NPDC091292]|uniref:LCP family protein n=1 Tax=Streptomyces sp. NPDC091292 TaxID=3365991 RepID=UPI00382E3E79